MLMNRIETAVINSPPRRWLQRAVEARILEQLGGRMAGGTALEIGCGRGAGIELILDRFAADHVLGLDIDEKMIASAHRRLAERSGQVGLRLGDAGRTGLPDNSVDAVFDFATVHHICDWRAALREVHWVLRPGGRFYFEEVTRHALERPTYRALFDHPQQDRFTARQLTDTLDRLGLHVGTRHVALISGDYVLGIAERL